MISLAIVRGATQRDLLFRETETVGCAALDDGQALEGLDGRAWIDRGCDGTLRRNDMP